eukprot:CAMPEP_0114234560 /NCGR_PEP_ID=MMETSP0058-20121206/5773_1 /TAXON_ID=36894 /ORGANISM="Pyramimonas parkeae, CCMP726" /LENGTH=272 /DNA_ID=CAMNT_0001346245 /DNA_START=210 /DNA_END=1028 /DNA_ORIENTATION=-
MSTSKSKPRVQPAKQPAVAKTPRTKRKSENVPMQPPTDVRKRCEWSSMCPESSKAAFIKYHDDEWGRPIYDDKKLFEMITLEGAQAGLSWATILNKRKAYAECFANWDINAVAQFSPEMVEKLLLPESGIVKHRGKIVSTVKNAQLILDIQQAHGSLSSFLWSYVGNKPMVNTFKNMQDLPAQTDESTAMSKDLKKLGFKFVGPTMTYQLMQACGMVNDHTTDCFCRDPIIRAYSDHQAAILQASVEPKAKGSPKQTPHVPRKRVRKSAIPK